MRSLGYKVIRPDGKPHHPEDGWADEGHPLSIAIAPSVKATHWSQARALSWQKLQIDHKEMPRKEDAFLWSPVVLSDMARRSASVTHVSALVYDFDNGTTWDDVNAVLSCYGLRFWMYTTHSHTVDHHKFRAVLGLDEAIPADLFPKVWKEYAKLLGWEVDENCKDLGRLYYVPSCPPGGVAWQDWGDGVAMDWRALLASLPIEPEAPPPRQTVFATRRGNGDRDRRVTLRAAEKILQDIPASVGMRTWWAIVCGIVDALGREGFEMVRDWSMTCPDKFNSREWRAMERRFNV